MLNYIGTVLATSRAARPENYHVDKGVTETISAKYPLGVILPISIPCSPLGLS